MFLGRINPMLSISIRFELSMGFELSVGFDLSTISPTEDVPVVATE
jgi:hypothetical protein